MLVRASGRRLQRLRAQSSAYCRQPEGHTGHKPEHTGRIHAHPQFPQAVYRTRRRRLRCMQPELRASRMIQNLTDSPAPSMAKVLGWRMREAFWILRRPARDTADGVNAISRNLRKTSNCTAPERTPAFRPDRARASGGMRSGAISVTMWESLNLRRALRRGKSPALMHRFACRRVDPDWSRTVPLLCHNGAAMEQHLALRAANAPVHGT